MNARDYLKLLRESKLLVLGCVVGCLALTLVITLLLPNQYASVTTFYVVSNTQGQAAASENFQGAQLSTQRIKSYSQLMTGPRVAQDAAATLADGTTPDDVQSRVTATSVADTVLITLTTTGTSPERAVSLARAVTNAFTSLVRQLETPPGTDQQPAVIAQVVQPSSVPTSPNNPVLKINLLIGLLVGLVVGFGAAVARRAVSVSVNSVEALRALIQAPVLGVVPEDDRILDDPVSLLAPDPAAPATEARTEAYRRIRTNVEFASAPSRHRVLVVTSAMAGEGRTTTACNLASSLAAVGALVVLVEGDLRSPSIADYLGLCPADGLADVLTGERVIWAVARPWSPGRFHVVQAGTAPTRPNELLSSRRTADIIAELRSRYDYVVIDSPPLLPFSDAINLGIHADGVIVVSRWGAREPRVETAITMLREVSVPVMGAVLSCAPRTETAPAERRLLPRRSRARRGPEVVASSAAVAPAMAQTTVLPVVGDADDGASAPPAAADERSAAPKRARPDRSRAQETAVMPPAEHPEETPTPASKQAC